MFAAAALVVLSSALGQSPALVAESRPVRHVVCVLEFQLSFSDAYQLNELCIAAPAAQELPHHQLKASTKMLSPAGGALAKELEAPFRAFMATRLRPVAKQSVFPIKIQYEATMLERRLVPGGAKSGALPGLDAKSRERWLAPTEWYDYKAPEFAKWLKQTALERGPRETPLAFAQRAFVTVSQKYAYKAATPGRPASQVIALKEADCDNLSFLYIAALRANGIPARMLLGRSSVKSASAAESGRMPGHGAVELYADNVGWIYCDPAGGASHPKKPLDHFGRSNGHLLVLQIDPDMKVPGSKADTVRTVRSLTSPSFASRGKGKTESKMTPLSWTVTAGP